MKILRIPSESETVEWKKSLAEWKDIVETCASFAAAKGGRIFVGVGPDGTIHGIQLGKGTVEDIANKIAQNTHPRLTPSLQTTAKNGQTILLLDVQPHSSRPVYAFNHAFRRVGATNQKLSPGEAADWHFQHRGITWDETVLSEVHVKDLDGGRVRDFLIRAQAERRWNVNPSTPLPQVLRQLHLLNNGKVTVAANLLFGKNPQWAMVQSQLRCARFKGNVELDFIDMKVLDGTVIAQVDEAMNFIKRNIRSGAEIKDVERKDLWEYPLDALREAVVNAVCHRDYASPGNVQIRIFDDRLEVWNPGGLPAGLTVEDLHRLHESKPRNKRLAHVFFLLRLVEQFGTGTRRIIADCVKTGLPEPEFESRADSFRVVFRKTPGFGEAGRERKLGDRQKRAIEYVLQHGKITREQYEKLVGTTKPTAKRDLAVLVKKGILRSRGSSRLVWYEMSAAKRTQT
ncbi:MAG: helix-turn-helix domain-containing protein [Verrucomicrobiae bacterium]|nr:helix-turn-helix domain-containing protein [Verrucomicrobiae bacterium]